MKVVQINAVCHSGSTGRIVDELSKALNGEDIDNIVAYADGVCNLENSIRIGNDLDHKFHALFSRIFGLQGYFSHGATKRFIRFLDEYQPDIIHLHNLHSNYINLPMLFKYISKNNIATVITLHDCFFFTGKCVHYIIAGCNRWQEKCGNCLQLESGNASWFFDRTFKMLNDRKHWYQMCSRLGIIGVSNWITGEARKSVLRVANKVQTIYNWIDMDIFYPHESDIRKRLGISNKYLVLGVASLWDDTKGIDDFNQIADMLDDRFKVVIVGTCKEKLNNKILKISQTDDIDMLSDLYADADVFYNPTRRETFGKVTAEALACGTPVITYDTTACTELVADNCGYIEKIGDIKAVYNDILNIIDSNIDYETNCRKFARDNFDKEKCLNQTIEFYKELLDD